MQELQSFGQLGIAGLAVYLFYRIASNHIDHNTKVMLELRDVIRELKEFMQNHK